MFKLKISPSVRALLAGVLASACAAAIAEPVTCGDYMNDAAALQAAPHGAARPDPHTLTVRHRRGVERFVDQPPYEEAFGGERWYYCGFVPALRAHLIGRNEGDLFSGVLLLDDTGALIDAGQSVLPSPDGSSFLAERQVSGEDGSRWLVATRAGRALWDGYAGELRTVRAQPGGEAVEHVVMSFEAPRWADDGALRAAAVCTTGAQAKGVATFALKEGSWRWQTGLTCDPVEAGRR